MGNGASADSKPNSSKKVNVKPVETPKKETAANNKKGATTPRKGKFEEVELSTPGQSQGRSRAQGGSQRGKASTSSTGMSKARGVCMLLFCNVSLAGEIH